MYKFNAALFWHFVKPSKLQKAEVTENSIL